MRIFLFIVYFLSFICYSQIANSTHIVGGELNYRYLGSNNYEITLTVYRDCFNGIPPFDNPAGVGIFNSNNLLIDTLLMAFTGSDTIEPTINAPCFIPPVNICYEVTTYIDTINLAPSVGGYQLVYQRCCRNQTILNIINPVNTGATYYANIPGTGLAVNNSNPVFVNWPPPFICNNIPFVFDHSATDIDGDSITYELCNPFVGATPSIPQPIPPFSPPYASVIWANPFSLSNVIGSSPPLTINSQSGLITVTPTSIGQFVIAVCAKEYRNGVLISTTRRDFQLNVVNCPTLLIAALQAPTYNCGTNTVSFQNQSIGASTFFWDFGDTTTLADTSIAVTPAYTYPDTGSFQVTLIAFSPINPTCIDTNVRTVNVLPDYTVDFTYQLDSCTYNVSFNDTSNLDSGPTVDWHWDFGDGDSSLVEDPTHSFPGPGTYTVIFSGVSARGCEESINKQIVIPSILNINTNSVTPVKCNSQCNGSASVIAQNGIAPYNYLWSDASSQNTSIATNLCAGNYLITVTDDYGCIAIDTVIITEPDSLLSLTSTTDAYCGGQCFGTGTSIPSGGTSPYVYLWSDGNNQITQTATSLCPGFYTVLIIDGNACTRTDVIEINSSNSRPLVIASATEDTIFAGQSTQLFSNTAVGYSYSWSPPNSLNHPNSSTTTAIPFENTDYIITVTDSNGCTNSDTVRIILKGTTCDEPEIFIANAITPNSDNINDIAYVRGRAIRELLFRVYNRWGEIIFESKDKSNGWDGYYKSEPVAPGVYVYYLKATCFGENEFEKQGNITVIR